MAKDKTWPEKKTKIVKKKNAKDNIVKKRVTQKMKKQNLIK